VKSLSGLRNYTRVITRASTTVGATCTDVTRDIDGTARHSHAGTAGARTATTQHRPGAA
jgi:hypothetical protein